MESVLTTIVAVVGTLLGAYLTYLFQRRSALQDRAEERAQRRREEYLDALTTYAVNASALRRAEFDRAKKRLGTSTPEAREEARQECYRRRADARSALYRLRMLADPVTDRELVDRAAQVIRLSQEISSGPTTEADMHDRGQLAERALEKLIDAANRLLREADR